MLAIAQHLHDTSQSCLCCPLGQGAGQVTFQLQTRLTGVQVYAWGCNTSGQLGLSHTELRRSPTIVDALWALPVQQLAAGTEHSAALTSNGFLFTWGGNDKGQLGIPVIAEVAAQHQVSSGTSLYPTDNSKRVCVTPVMIGVRGLGLHLRFRGLFCGCLWPPSWGPKCDAQASLAAAITHLAVLEWHTNEPQNSL